jgi:uncharacterized protein YndB with AHSA1/START domain
MSARETVLVSEVIPTSRDRIYSAWLDSRQHSAFTGETADIDPEVGGHISTFSGYASGKNIELEPARRIVQSWRSTEFPAGSPDSRLEVTLEDTSGGTLVTVLHTEIPEGQGDRYREGWVRYYLEPMKRYFSRNLSNGVNHHDQSTIEQMAADALEDDEDDSDEAGDDAGKEAGDESTTDEKVGGGRGMASAAGGDEDDDAADESDDAADEADDAGDDALTAASDGDDDGDDDDADDDDDGDDATEEGATVIRAEEEPAAGSGGEGLEVIEEATLPMVPPVPAKARQSGARPRPRATSGARNGRPARGQRVEAALAKLSAGAKSARKAPAKKAAAKKAAAKKAPAKVQAKGKGKAKAAAKKPAAKVQAKGKARPGKTAIKKTAKNVAKASVSAKAKAKAKPAKGGKPARAAKSRKR